MFEGNEKINGFTMADTILKKRETCFGCVVRCKRAVETTWKGKPVTENYGAPEFETIGTFGSYCEVNDLDAISYANQLCNAYGMDTISAGAAVAFAMDCYENKLLGKEETDGIELRFGNTDAMVAMVEKMVKGEGLGKVLADGPAALIELLGKEAEQYCVAVKNQYLPAHMPQIKRSLGLIYAVSPIGADHQSSEHDGAYEEGAFKLFKNRLSPLGLQDPQQQYSLTDEKVRFAYYTQLFFSMMDSISCCQFVYGPSWQLYDTTQFVEMVRAVTGWNVSLWELMKVGERRLNLMRAFNAREGFSRDDDSLPKKLTRPLKGGPTDGLAISAEEIERAKDCYYAMCGWDNQGTPSRGKLVELGLEWAADAIDA